MNITIEYCIFELVEVSNFSLNWQFWFFWPHLFKKGIYGLKQKSEHRRWILYIRISLDTEFQLKLMILIFGSKLAQKGYLRSET